MTPLFVSRGSQRFRLPVWPSYVGSLHSGDAPWARAERTSMPLGPLHAACVQPAPKSRFVVFGLLMSKSKSTAETAAPDGNGCPLRFCFCRRRRSALARDLPRSGSKIGQLGLPDTPYAQALLPVPGRSRASALLRLRQNQKHGQQPALAPAFDLHTEKVQTTQNATWVQAERRRCGVGRAAWMPRERCQDMDVRSARAHGASPK
jgi:hypothetical protein